MGETDSISRQAAIEATWFEPSYADPLNVLTEVRDKLKALPSAQPEIVRCKDCAKREYCRTSTVWAVAPDDDWYCADAEPYKGEK